MICDIYNNNKLIFKVDVDSILPSIGLTLLIIEADSRCPSGIQNFGY